MSRNLVTLSKWSAVFAVLVQTPALAVEAVPPPSDTAPITTQAIPLQPAVAIKRGPLFRHSSYPVAWTAAQKTNRPILVYVSMPNCPHCVKMVNETYHRPQVQQLVAGSFETIKAGRYTHAKLVSKLHIKWYPTTVLVGPNNKILDVIEGYVGHQRFKRRLQTGIAAMHKPTATQVR